MLGQKVRKNIMLLRITKIFARLCKLFLLNIECTSYTDEVRENVPSFKKVCLFEDVTDYSD